MPTVYLPDEDHVVRHLTPRQFIRDDETKEIVGCLPMRSSSEKARGFCRQTGLNTLMAASQTR